MNRRALRFGVVEDVHRARRGREGDPDGRIEKPELWGGGHESGCALKIQANRQRTSNLAFSDSASSSTKRWHACACPISSISAVKCVPRLYFGISFLRSASPEEAEAGEADEGGGEGEAEPAGYEAYLRRRKHAPEEGDETEEREVT